MDNVIAKTKELIEVIIEDIQIQNIEPGPPIYKARAIPARDPTPIRAASAIVKL